MVIMMDNEGPFERAARSLETVTGVPSTPVDVRTECEDLREQLARARAAVVAMLGELMFLDHLYDTARVVTVQKSFSITEDELAAEYQRQYNEWVQGSSDGQ